MCRLGVGGRMSTIFPLTISVTVQFAEPIAQPKSSFFPIALR